jgi:hypothetical protein
MMNILVVSVLGISAVQKHMMFQQYSHCGGRLSVSYRLKQPLANRKAQLAGTESAKFHTVSKTPGNDQQYGSNIQRDTIVSLVPKISRSLEVTHHGQILYIFHSIDIKTHILF